MADPSFEELYAALEEKARRLEQGNLPLEDSLRLYDEGAALVDALRKILEGAELQVKTLQGRLDEHFHGVLIAKLVPRHQGREDRIAVIDKHGAAIESFSHPDDLIDTPHG